MTNLTLLAASIGFRMMQGYDFANALHGAACDHDAECTSWEKARQPKWDMDNMAQMEQPGQTMREWFGEVPATPERMDHQAIDDMEIEMIERARQICADEEDFREIADLYLSGALDGRHAMRCTLRALRETSK